MLIGLVHSALLKGQAINNTAVKFSARTTSSSQVNPSPDLVDGFIGQTRTVGTDFDWFINTNSGNFVKASTTPPGTGIGVFAYGAGSIKMHPVLLLTTTALHLTLLP